MPATRDDDSRPWADRYEDADADPEELERRFPQSADERRSRWAECESVKE